MLTPPSRNEPSSCRATAVEALRRDLFHRSSSSASSWKSPPVYSSITLRQNCCAPVFAGSWRTWPLTRKQIKQPLGRERPDAAQAITSHHEKLGNIDSCRRVAPDEREAGRRVIDPNEEGVPANSPSKRRSTCSETAHRSVDDTWRKVGHVMQIQLQQVPQRALITCSCGFDVDSHLSVSGELADGFGDFRRVGEHETLRGPRRRVISARPARRRGGPARPGSRKPSSAIGAATSAPKPPVMLSS